MDWYLTKKVSNKVSLYSKEAMEKDALNKPTINEDGFLEL